MKSILLFLFTLLILSSCNGQEAQTDAVRNLKGRYESIGDTTLSFGKQNRIMGCKYVAGDDYLLHLRTEREGGQTENRVLEINPKTDAVRSLPADFAPLLSDFIERDGFYYSITTDRRTMGGFTQDYLNKYDRDWKPVWSKALPQLKYPSGLTVLALTTNNEILVVANEMLLASAKGGLSFRRYNLEGALIWKNLMITSSFSNPHSLIPAPDSNFYLTASGPFSREEDLNPLWLMKLTPKGDTLWTKKYAGFFPKQTFLGSNGDLVFYGINYGSEEERETHHKYIRVIVLDKDGNLKWKKSLKQYFGEEPGNVLETKEGNYLFSGTITPVKDGRTIAGLFELGKNDGSVLFRRQFDYPVGIGSVPFVMRSEGQITVVDQKWIGEFGEPFHDVIQITKLRE